MPPEPGGICGRLTQDLPLGCLQGGGLLCQGAEKLVDQEIRIVIDADVDGRVLQMEMENRGQSIESSTVESRELGFRVWAHTVHPQSRELGCRVWARAICSGTCCPPCWDGEPSGLLVPLSQPWSDERVVHGRVRAFELPAPSRPVKSFWHRGTSLIRNRPTPAPYSRFMSRALWWS